VSWAILIASGASLATSAASAGISKAIGGGGKGQRLSDAFGKPDKRDKKIPLSSESTAAKIQGLQPSTSLLGGVGEDPAARERRLRMLRGI